MPAAWAAGFSPEVATVIHLGDRFALFPQATADFSWAWSGDASTNGITLTGFAPAVFIPVPHLFLGFGPVIDWEVSGNASGSTVFGLQSQIGGWF